MRCNPLLDHPTKAIIIMSAVQKIIIGSAITLCAAISFFAYMHIEKKNVEQHRLEIWQSQKQFETVLNTFLKDLATRVDEYKKQRRVISELIKIENITEPQYISENYTMMIATTTQMRQQTQVILAQFTTMDQSVSELITQAKLIDKDAIQDVWTTTKTEQLKFYTAFFNSEENILRIHESLIEFYDTYKTQFSIDLDNDSIVFDAPVLRARHDTLNAMLQTQKARQSAVLRSNQ